ncbi:MAG: prepilin-type N-terminal cleavage/methylation domain-containing protein [Candidatus Omnitrophica bacterium]|nr:prepilin-type N-terminal cleavage/methylation domain-containing protein [Candidatus Omnitrophota bacterium]
MLYHKIFQIHKMFFSKIKNSLPPGEKGLSLKGFTLIEVLVSTVIFSIIVACVFTVIIIGDRSWHTDLGLLDVHQQARQAMHGMIRELRQKSANSSINISANNSEIQFYITNVTNPVRYYLDNETIMRQHSSQTRALATNVTNLHFCCRSASGATTCDANCTNSTEIVYIEVNASKTSRQRTLNFNLSEQAHFRNE